MPQTFSTVSYLVIISFLTDCFFAIKYLKFPEPKEVMSLLYTDIKKRKATNCHIKEADD